MYDGAYKLFKSKSEFEGTDYIEFLPGEFKDECWNDISVFINEDGIYIIEDIFEHENEKYDHYEINNYFNESQLINVINSLSKRYEEIKNNVYIVNGYTEWLNDDIKNYRDEILLMIEELLSWLKSNKEKNLTIIGL